MVGTTIRDFREFNSMSQTELAHKLGFSSQGTVSLWERGEREPTLKTIKKLSVLFHCTTDELLKEV